VPRAALPPGSLDDGSLLTLGLAAEQMGWSRRTLTRALERHGMATIGTGRRARLEAADIEILKTKEREACSINSTPQEPAKATGSGLPVGLSTDDSLRRYWKRRLGQQQRKRPSGSSPGSKVIPLGR
jgi:hypothetical protein